MYKSHLSSPSDVSRQIRSDKGCHKEICSLEVDCPTRPSPCHWRGRLVEIEVLNVTCCCCDTCKYWSIETGNCCCNCCTLSMHWDHLFITWPVGTGNHSDVFILALSAVSTMCVSDSAHMAVVTVSKVTTLVQAYGAWVSSLLLLWHGTLHVERILVNLMQFSAPLKGKTTIQFLPGFRKGVSHVLIWQVGEGTWVNNLLLLLNQHWQITGLMGQDMSKHSPNLVAA